VAGDRNVVHFQQVTLPAADEVDMASEVATLRELLGRLDSTDRRKIDNAFADAADELARPEPDRDEVGKALDRALEYGKKAKDFAGIVEALKPHVVGAVGWLGKNWHKILGVVGLTV
jgi:hypothetical protein